MGDIRLSCSFAINVSAVFVFPNCVCFKQKTSALCSFALELIQSSALLFSSDIILKIKKSPLKRTLFCIMVGDIRLERMTP